MPRGKRATGILPAKKAGRMSRQTHQLSFLRAPSTLHLPRINLDFPQMKSHLTEMKTNLPQVKLDFPQMKSHLTEMKINLPQVKLDLPQMKLHLAQMRLDLPQMKPDLRG